MVRIQWFSKTKKLSKEPRAKSKINSFSKEGLKEAIDENSSLTLKNMVEIVHRTTCCEGTISSVLHKPMKNFKSVILSVENKNCPRLKLVRKDMSANSFQKAGE